MKFLLDSSKAFLSRINTNSNFINTDDANNLYLPQSKPSEIQSFVFMKNMEIRNVLHFLASRSALLFYRHIFEGTKTINTRNIILKKAELGMV